MLFIAVSVPYAFTSCQYGADEADSYAKARTRFVESYDKPFIQDTSFINDSHKYHVWLNYRCLFDRAVAIPKKFIWGNSGERFVAHNFVADIVVLKNDQVVFGRTISKDRFRKLLYDREEDMP
jgi:hypothetical protein